MKGSFAGDGAGGGGGGGAANGDGVFAVGAFSSTHGDDEARGGAGAAALGAVGDFERLCSMSSSTLWIRLCDSNGLVTTASQPALSARSGSKGSNVPVRRMTGIVRYSGCDLTNSHTS